jgi:hypothetical protein
LMRVLLIIGIGLGDHGSWNQWYLLRTPENWGGGYGRSPKKLWPKIMGGRFHLNEFWPAGQWGWGRQSEHFGPEAQKFWSASPFSIDVARNMCTKNTKMVHQPWSMEKCNAWNRRRCM